MKSRLNFEGYSKRAKWVIYPTMTLALINFFSFVAISLYLGGDALNGYIQAGKYFVCAHGSCTQVSPEIWHYSYWHAKTAMAGILLCIAEAVLFIITGDIKIE